MKRFSILLISFLIIGMASYSVARSILPAVISGTNQTGRWYDWDESSESKLQNSEILAMVVANVNVDGDETAQGMGLTGADLVMTIDNMAGLSGTSRAVVTNSGVTVTSTCLNTLFSKDTFTIVIKLEDAGKDGAATYYYVSLKDSSNTNTLIIWQQQAANIRAIFIDSGELDTGTKPQAVGICYFAVWKKPGGNVFVGYKNDEPKPTSISDFTDTMDMGTSTMPAEGAWIIRSIIGRVNDASSTAPCNLYYIVAAKAMLFSD